MQRHYPPEEYAKFEGQPLPASELAALWKGLPEGKRLGFILALDEQIADRVIELCTPATAPAERKQG